jgi:drug/metabolite transporter (DMT)-like permease
MAYQVKAPEAGRGLAGSDAFYKLLVLVAASLWGVNFVVQKGLAAQFTTFQILTVNFLVGGLALLVAFWRPFVANLDARTIRAGIIIGVAGWMGYVCQVTGIAFTTPGKSAFISGCYCVLVPFIGMAARIGKPEPHNVVAALLCVAGLGLIGADGGAALNAGDILSFGSAVFVGIEFVLVAKFGRNVGVRALTIWQVLTMGALSLVGTMLCDRPPALAAFTPGVVASFLYEALLCACLCNALVNYAFTKIDPTSGSLITSLESPIGAATSIALGLDLFTPRLAGGFVLIFLSVIVSEAWRGIRVRLVRAIEGDRHHAKVYGEVLDRPAAPEQPEYPSVPLLPDLTDLMGVAGRRDARHV